jgi:hypothetical protein
MFFSYIELMAKTNQIDFVDFMVELNCSLSLLHQFVLADIHHKFFQPQCSCFGAILLHGRLRKQWTAKGIRKRIGALRLFKNMLNRNLLGETARHFLFSQQGSISGMPSTFGLTPIFKGLRLWYWVCGFDSRPCYNCHKSSSSMRRLRYELVSKRFVAFSFLSLTTFSIQFRKIALAIKACICSVSVLSTDKDGKGFDAMILSWLRLYRCYGYILHSSRLSPYS